METLRTQWKQEAKKSLTVHHAVALEESHSEAAALLANVNLTTDHVSAISFALVVQKADPGEFVKQWAEENAALVDSWMK